MTLVVFALELGPFIVRFTVCCYIRRAASRAGSCDQWSAPNSNRLPSTLSVQKIVTEYIVLDGDWVGIRERVIEGVMITVWCHRRSPVPDLPDMYMLNEEPKLESRYSCRVEREERAIQNSLVLASVQIQIIEINGCKYSTVSCT